MVSLWWVAAAFFVGGYAGVVLVAVMSMAARQTGDACQPRGPGRSSIVTTAAGCGGLGPDNYAEAQSAGRLIPTTGDLACSDSARPVYATRRNAVASHRFIAGSPRCGRRSCRRWDLSYPCPWRSSATRNTVRVPLWSRSRVACFSS